MTETPKTPDVVLGPGAKDEKMVAAEARLAEKLAATDTKETE